MSVGERVIASGKHFGLDGRPFRVRGVTYGSFVSRVDGHPFPENDVIQNDFSMMSDAGINMVRIYDIPPPELLSAAAANGLRVLAGLNYSDWRMESESGSSVSRRVLRAGRQAVADAMEVCAKHPAVLGIAVGNELPVDLVRLHGSQAVQSVLSELIGDVHAADPEMLATYVNFPTTEFLEVEGQDFLSFNVFLEDSLALGKYLGSLQTLANGKPLLVTELGLASEVHGELAQRESLDWQLRVVDESGCGGAAVFSWTDEWAVADVPVTEWGFGLTGVNRQRKPALEVVERWAQSQSPIDLRPTWPRLSVIVCAYNEEPTIEECLFSLAASTYPELEVIVCDDGSTDRTLELAHGFHTFKILELAHGGLSTARNAGLEAASGELVAYLDADAACHPDWPFYLVLSMEDPNVVATGGPNLPHPNAGLVERAVALSPGSPMEVLIAPDRAEHVPGCNMAFRKKNLDGIGGFNPLYTSAGDDVDVCWKLLDQGHNIGFAPAAEVIHHRRGTVRGYLKQQRGYGRAEKMLSGPHRNRFNRLGQARWSGVVYGGSRLLPSLFTPVVYTGYMGMAPFQPIVRRRSELVATWATALLPLVVPLMVLGAALSLLSAWWLALPAGLILAAAVYVIAVAAALQVDHKEPHPLQLRALVGAMHLLQPLVRTWGRLGGKSAGPPLPSAYTWVGDRIAWLANLQRALEVDGCQVKIGEAGDSWDLTVLGGSLTSARVTTAVVWNWEPRSRVAYRLRPLFWFLMSIAVVGILAGSPFGWVLAAAASVWCLGSAAILRHQIGRAVSRTTEAAHV